MLSPALMRRVRLELKVPVAGAGEDEEVLGLEDVVVWWRGVEAWVLVVVWR